MLMPFGKYKGHDLDALPDEYLLWVIANIPLREPLRSALTDVLSLRGYEALPPPPAPPRPHRVGVVPLCYHEGMRKT